MSTVWSKVRLGNVCIKIGSGATPRGGSEVYMATGPYALIRSQNVHNDGFRHDGLAFISERHASELANVEVLEGDVLLNITGDSVARVCQVDRRILPARVNQHVAIIRPRRQAIDPHFLRYALVSPEMQARMVSWAGSGGTRNALTKAMVESFDVLAPTTLGAQRAIASVLGMLDDRIELNRQLNETLETMARALFRSWFIDFDPVRAKADGRDSRLPKSLTDLFPDSFEDSELGEIPKGWKVGCLHDVVEQLRDQENPLASPEALYHHFSLPAFDDGQSPKAEYGESIKSQKSRVPAGTVLLSKLNPEIERVWLVDVRTSERAVCSTEFLVLRPRAPFTRSFAYCLVRSPGFRQQIEGLVTGTSKSHQRAPAGAVLDLAAVIPPAAVVTAFDRTAENLLKRVLENRRASRTLADLRDVLLPKLISGELRLRSLK